MTEATRIVFDSKDLANAIRLAPETYQRTMSVQLERMLHEGRKVMVGEMKRKLSKGGEGHLASSLAVNIKASRLEGEVASPLPYMKFADQGRGPGKMPPHDEIELWVHRMGIGTRATGAEREEARPARVHTPSGERKERVERTPRKPKTEEPDRDEIIFLIRKNIAARGTFEKSGPPRFVKSTMKKHEPRVRELYDEGVEAFVGAVSTKTK